MPTLPNVTQLERRTPSPGRGLVQVRPSPIPLGPLAGGAGVEAEGMVRVGQSLLEVGNTIEKTLIEPRRAAVMNEAVGKATAALGELEVSFDRDQDFRTAPRRFMQQAEALRAQIEAGIEDDAVRQAFGTRFNELTAAKRINVLKSAAKQEGDATVAALDSSLDTYAHSAANSRGVAERAIVINQAQIAITEARTAGWITDVDAGKRMRGFQAKLEAATVTRDMTIDAGSTATRLASDPEYARHLDPEARERLIDSGYRRAEAERTRIEREAEKSRKAREDEILKNAFDLQATGSLTREFVLSAKPFVSPAAYHSLLKAVDEGVTRDDPASFAELQRLVYDNPAEAERRAFTYQRNGLIRNETLSSVLSRSREIGRQEGPRSEYERSRAFLVSAFTPPPILNDDASSARLALVLREYDDFAAGAKRTDDELRKETDRVFNKYAIANMLEVARRSGMGAQPTPQQQLEALRVQGEKLIADRDAKRISEKEFTKKMAEINKVRAAAERAAAPR